MPSLKIWKGLCEIFLISTEKIYSTINRDEISCRNSKCSFCGRRGRVYPVEVQIPDFPKGIVKNRRTSAHIAWNQSMRLISGTNEKRLMKMDGYMGMSMCMNIKE